jgi:hypothetical protein
VSAHLTHRYAVSVSAGGVSNDFAQPFVAPQLTLDAPPARYQVSVAPETSVTVWDGTPLPSDFDVLWMQSDNDVDVEFTVDGGDAGEHQFTLFLRGGGFPIAIPGSRSYTRVDAGDDSFVDGTVGSITQIRAHNADTEDTALIDVLIGQ